MTQGHNEEEARQAAIAKYEKYKKDQTETLCKQLEAEGCNEVEAKMACNYMLRKFMTKEKALLRI